MLFRFKQPSNGSFKDDDDNNQFPWNQLLTLTNQLVANLRSRPFLPLIPLHPLQPQIGRTAHFFPCILICPSPSLYVIYPHHQFKGTHHPKMAHRNGNGNGIGHHAVIDILKPSNFTGGLEFSSLTYTVTKKEKIDGHWTSQEVDLLHRITGYAPKGCVTAVMGPSGAGKSTFLDGLAGRIASGSLMGRVSLDGAETSPSLIKRRSAYIMQDDRLFPMLTVYETLIFAADFRLGSISRSDKKLRVEKLIEQLGLAVGDSKTQSSSSISNDHRPIDRRLDCDQKLAIS